MVAQDLLVRPEGGRVRGSRRPSDEEVEQQAESFVRGEQRRQAQRPSHEVMDTLGAIEQRSMVRSASWLAFEDVQQAANWYAASPNVSARTWAESNASEASNDSHELPSDAAMQQMAEALKIEMKPRATTTRLPKPSVLPPPAMRWSKSFSFAKRPSASEEVLL